MTQSVIGALRVNLGLDSAQFESGAKRAQPALKAMRVQFLAVAAAAAALGTAISAMAMRSAGQIDAVAKSARRLDSSVLGFRALEMAAGEAGVPVEALADAVQVMDREIAKGSKGAAASLKRIGLAASDLSGLDADQKIALIADRVKEMGLTSGEASALLQGLGIRSKEMVLAVMAGGDALRAARRDVADYGLALSKVETDKIEEANDRIGRLGLIGQYVGEQLALKLVPSLGRLALAMTDSLRAGGALRSGVDALVGNLDRLGAYAASLVTVLGVRYVAALAAARVATMTLAGATAALGAALLRLPFVAVVVVIGEAVVQFGRLTAATGSVGEAIKLLGDVAREIFDRIKLRAQAVGVYFDATAQSMRAAILSAAGFTDAAANAAADAANLTQLANSLSQVASGPLTSIAALRAAMTSTTEAITATTTAATTLGEALGEGGASGSVATGAKGAAQELKKLDVATVDVGDRFGELRSIGVRAFEGLATGTMKFKDAVASLSQDLTRMIANKAFTKFFDIATTALFSSISGPTPALATASVGKNANGTSYWRGGLSMIGERGPELVNLPRGSQVIDARRTAQSLGEGSNSMTTINVDARGANDPGMVEAAARRGAAEALATLQAGPGFSRMVRSAQARRG